MENKVYSFLKKYGMNSDSIDMEKLTSEFIDEMKRGLSGDVRSLLMIPTYVGVDKSVPANEKVIVLDAGGTNLRSACVSFDDTLAPTIEGFKKQPMLGTQGEISKEEFYDSLAALIEPFDKQSDKVGFCFSFPTEILPNCDGKLIYFNKEVKVRDMEGEIIGEGINRALRARGCGEKKFVIINDTVATMLGGIVACPEKQYDSYIGFILGTGTNACYIEDKKNITKLGDIGEGTMTINIETGGFDKMSQGVIDKEFDATTANAGDHKFEKMISGAYQDTLIYRTLLHAAQDGLFSDKTAQRINAAGDLTMRQIDEFCTDTKGDNFIASLPDNDADRAVIYDIIDDSFERSARLVAVNFAAILLCADKGKDKNRPVCISAEGTTFYKSVLFRPKLERYIKEFLNDRHGVYCDFIKAEDATIIGSAVAGLIN